MKKKLGIFSKNLLQELKKFLGKRGFLDKIHTQGFAHRDIKLENLLFGDDYTLKICDFGSATDKETSSDKVGSLGYMCPEMHEGREYNCQQADLFSLAIVLFMLITGRPPFKSASGRRYQARQKTIPGDFN
jgi:serine/threonine protein kinase